MKTKKITMGQRELHRRHILEMAEVGKITLKEAASSIGVSYRYGQKENSGFDYGGPLKATIAADPRLFIPTLARIVHEEWIMRAILAI